MSSPICGVTLVTVVTASRGSSYAPARAARTLPHHQPGTVDSTNAGVGVKDRVEATSNDGSSRSLIAEYRHWLKHPTHRLTHDRKSRGSTSPSVPTNRAARDDAPLGVVPFGRGVADIPIALAFFSRSPEKTTGRPTIEAKQA
jgi:hypothetical protein